ncbi:hypothetical protein PNP85_13065 [Halobacterium salinarum]|uniref:hypothetical protein n=1 Tax=Halobacterium salinarum TaxID=2242 RepID=UPI001F18D15E|nr:hypothetical protein [Halobacterium salinarum]MCF2165404.1 hypothetical protein [Halobacterium salinarum]MCF2168215.1 hypothetical protein [Halobacterium salinarum]MCF2237604.1 hypothetical protein [Halobacterium salinarum]MDL0140434.1 hypothetical protein [Halobacterium salinarum]
MTDDELEQLRQQTDVGTRAQEATPSDESTDLEDAMVTLLAAVEAGETSKTLSVRDARLTALVRALEETGELEEVGTDLQEALGREAAPDAIDRSEVLRLAVRLGLQEAAPDLLETARDAYGRHASEQF